MSIFPLPVFETDADPRYRVPADDTDQDIYERLEPPRTIVVRFGRMKMVGEFKYEGDAKPGCGSKLVARTPRGTELVEMLTTTCENAGCSKSVTRQEMLDYIENSGGKDFPFTAQGRVIRVATVEDLNTQSGLDDLRREAVKSCKSLITELELDMKLVEAEPILGGELLTFYYMAEERVDFRDLVRHLAAHFKTRIEMRQVGARDEARLVADYERCGQHCCCKNFLKVLKPVSMKAAKMQKASLDPLKISGRCGRLMCCLRYEDQTYRELKAKLPHKRTRVGTAEGPGIVIDSKILVQLALVELEHDKRQIAVPIEELMDPDKCPPPGSIVPDILQDPLRGLPESDVKQRTDGKKRRRRSRREKGEQQDAYRDRAQKEDAAAGSADPEAPAHKKRRRRRGRKRGSGSGGGDAGAGGQKPATPSGDGAGAGGEGASKKRRRRRGGRRRGRGGGSGGGDGSSGGGGGSGGGD